MSYSLQNVSTPTECDLLLETAQGRMLDADFKKLTLERSIRKFHVAAKDTDGAIKAVIKELDDIRSVITLTDDDRLNRKKNQLEYRLHALKTRKESQAVSTLIQKEFDLELVVKELDQINAFIRLVEKRKKDLLHSEKINPI